MPERYAVTVFPVTAPSVVASCLERATFQTIRLSLCLSCELDSERAQVLLMRKLHVQRGTRSTTLHSVMKHNMLSTAAALQ